MILFLALIQKVVLSLSLIPGAYKIDWHCHKMFWQMTLPETMTHGLKATQWAWKGPLPCTVPKQVLCKWWKVSKHGYVCVLVCTCVCPVYSAHVHIVHTRVAPTLCSMGHCFQGWNDTFVWQTQADNEPILFKMAYSDTVVAFNLNLQIHIIPTHSMLMMLEHFICKSRKG